MGDAFQARAGGPSDLSRSVSQPEALIAIAEECEAAPSRDQQSLLRAAYKAVFGGPECIPIGRWPGYSSPRWDRFHLMLNAEAFLDAAMTLVPEGLDPQICKGPMFALAANEQRPWGVSLIGNAQEVEGECGPELTYDSHDANAATAALALCAAALRARASGEVR